MNNEELALLLRSLVKQRMILFAAAILFSIVIIVLRVVCSVHAKKGKNASGKRSERVIGAVIILVGVLSVLYLPWFFHAYHDLNNVQYVTVYTTCTRSTNDRYKAMLFSNGWVYTVLDGEQVRLELLPNSEMSYGDSEGWLTYSKESLVLLHFQEAPK